VPISTAVPIPVIMVVDDQGIVEQSKAFKSIKSQMEGLGQAAEKEIAQKKNDLETAFQEFQRNARGGTIPADKIEEQRHDLALRQDALQKESDSRGQSLRQSYATALAKVKQSLFEIVRGLATERHSNLILLQSAAIPLDPAFDVSKEALVRLDKALPAVTVTVSTAPAAGTPAPAATAQTQPPKKK
jgi:Skp family chaperone for outer membrane proteins